MKGKENWQLQGTIKLSENVSWGTTTTTRYEWKWRDDDGPRLAGSNLLAFACSRPDCLDPGDRPPSIILHQPQILLVPSSLPRSQHFQWSWSQSWSISLICPAFSCAEGHTVLFLGHVIVGSRSLSESTWRMQRVPQSLQVVRTGLCSKLLFPFGFRSTSMAAPSGPQLLVHIFSYSVKKELVLVIKLIPCYFETPFFFSIH